MANIDTGGGGGGKRNKPQKHNLRVDFTPMVDMNMLLITFFMFVTTLSMPQVMDIVMPIDDPGNRSPAPAGKSLTLILGENDKVYYYHGFPDYEDYTQLHEASYREVRDVLLEKNSALVGRLKDLKTQLTAKAISKDEYQEQVKKIKALPEGITVMIKPTEKSVYRNLVEILDEMHICGVGKYAIMDMEESDEFVMENLIQKGQLTAMAGAVR